MDLRQLWLDILNLNWSQISVALYETLYMVFWPTVLATAIGIPLGLILALTSKGHILENRTLNQTIGSIVNILRSIPFILLLIMLIPLTRKIMGIAISYEAMVVPLSVGAAPFFARLVETSINEIDRGVIEAAQAMGSNLREIIWKVLIPEALPGLVAGITVTAVALVGYTAMAGVVGGGGLGDMAYRYGFQRNQPLVMYTCILLLVFMVQIIQTIGDWLSKRVNHR
ncbi:hypothetical protein BHU72_01400 [Desulfuribacillus stibiiarsenatis]|uniref:ABC transmembrane type-1 domain-containing protein n=1 Tax=Desulfuribacillus stibiiarsenatis TaxID=1390249 RepID=A0A1E5L9X9_9FIRM|nr:methionine ABC transporter permease [Desulfuribacillus stibiiarsenatis]OEH86942.1 hypothetical protein BHU72_01400 [Desulfuribacillus stibiiarsenatis]